VTFGFFEQEAWHEVVDWDSGAMKYREPPMEELPPGMYVPGINMEDSAPGFGLMMNDANREPDNLPAYMAVQLGLRMPDGKSRLFSFTFYYSFPQSQETDVMMVDPSGQVLQNRDYGDSASRKRRRARGD
jgi:hypothetical protein